MKRFFFREKGNVDEVWYLARDAGTGAVYVERQWASCDNSGCNRIEIRDFLEGPSTVARNNLLRSIGATITEANDAPTAQPRRREQSMN
jgi:hypothetical protein